MGMLTVLCLWKKEVVDIIKIHAPSLEPKGMDDDAGPQIRKFYAEVSQTLFLISMFKLQEYSWFHSFVLAKQQRG
ncbi:hypothetical protein K1719_005530 [Acacia pycnantha]|nr:hypothetical protein K1719_005530 [Acacia pycnantha]